MTSRPIARLLVGAFWLAAALLNAEPEPGAATLEERLRAMPTVRTLTHPALQALAEAIGETDDAVCRAAFQSADLEVGHKRALVLGYALSGKDEPFDFLSECLAATQDPPLRNTLFYCLHRLPLADHLEPLMAMADEADEPDEYHRLIASVPGRVAFDYFRAKYRDEASSRADLGAYLGMTATPDSVDPVLELLGSAEDRAIGVACARRILNLATVVAADAAVEAPELAAKLRAMQRARRPASEPGFDAETRDQLLALYADVAGSTNDLADSPTVRKLLDSPDYTRELNDAIRHLVDLRSERVRRVYQAKAIDFSFATFRAYGDEVAQLHDIDGKRRSRALLRLREATDARLLNTFVHFLGDPHDQVREDAVDCIYLLIDDEQAVAKIFSKGWQGGGAGATLSTSLVGAFLSFLTQSASSGDETTAGESPVDTEYVLAAVRRRLDDAHPDVVIAAMQALTRVRDKASYAKIMSLSQSSHFPVRMAAMDAIAKREMHDAAPYMDRLLQDANWRIRGRAARVYIEMDEVNKDEQAILEAAFERERDPFVLAELRGALAKTKSAVVPDILRGRLEAAAPGEEKEIYRLLLEYGVVTVDDLRAMQPFYESEPDDAFRLMWLAQAAEHPGLDVEDALTGALRTTNTALMPLVLKLATKRELELDDQLLPILPELDGKALASAFGYLLKSENWESTNRVPLYRSVLDRVGDDEYGRLVRRLYSTFGDEDEWVAFPEDEDAEPSPPAALVEFIRHELRSPSLVRQRWATAALIATGETVSEERLDVLLAVPAAPGTNKPVHAAGAADSAEALVEALNDLAEDESTNLVAQSLVLRAAEHYGLDDSEYDSYLEHAPTNYHTARYQRLDPEDKAEYLKYLAPAMTLAGLVEELKGLEAELERPVYPYYVSPAFEPKLKEADAEELIAFSRELKFARVDVSGWELRQIAQELAEEEGQGVVDYIRSSKDPTRLRLLPLVLKRLAVDDAGLVEEYFETADADELGNLEGLPYDVFRERLDAWALAKLKGSPDNRFLATLTQVGDLVSDVVVTALVNKATSAPVDEKALYLAVLSAHGKVNSAAYLGAFRSVLQDPEQSLALVELSSSRSLFQNAIAKNDDSADVWDDVRKRLTAMLDEVPPERFANVFHMARSYMALRDFMEVLPRLPEDRRTIVSVFNAMHRLRNTKLGAADFPELWSRLKPHRAHLTDSMLGAVSRRLSTETRSALLDGFNDLPREDQRLTWRLFSRQLTTNDLPHAFAAVATWYSVVETNAEVADSPVANDDSDPFGWGSGEAPEPSAKLDVSALTSLIRENAASATSVLHRALAEPGGDALLRYVADERLAALPPVAVLLEPRLAELGTDLQLALLPGVYGGTSNLAAALAIHLDLLQNEASRAAAFRIRQSSPAPRSQEDIARDLQRLYESGDFESPRAMALQREWQRAQSGEAPEPVVPPPSTEPPSPLVTNLQARIQAEKLQYFNSLEDPGERTEAFPFVADALDMAALIRYVEDDPSPAEALSLVADGLLAHVRRDDGAGIPAFLEAMKAAKVPVSAGLLRSMGAALPPETARAMAGQALEGPPPFELKTLWPLVAGAGHLDESNLDFVLHVVATLPPPRWQQEMAQVVTDHADDLNRELLAAYEKSPTNGVALVLKLVQATELTMSDELATRLDTALPDMPEAESEPLMPHILAGGLDHANAMRLLIRKLEDASSDDAESYMSIGSGPDEEVAATNALPAPSAEVAELRRKVLQAKAAGYKRIDPDYRIHFLPALALLPREEYEALLAEALLSSPGYIFYMPQMLSPLTDEDVERHLKAAVEKIPKDHLSGFGGLEPWLEERGLSFPWLDKLKEEIEARAETLSEIEIDEW